MGKAKRAGRQGMRESKKFENMLAETEKWQSRFARMLVILLLCVHPLALTAESYFRLTQQKFEFFAMCMGVTLFTVIIVWAARLLSEPRMLPRDNLSIADLALLGFAGVTLLSATLSPFRDAMNVWIGLVEPAGRYDGAVTQFLYITAFFIISRWYKPRQLDFVFFAISAMLVALIGIFQFYGMDFLKLWPNHIDEFYMENYYNLQFRSTLGNINIVSTYVCVAVLLCGFMYVKVESKWRHVWLGGSALSFWMMIVGGSFSGMVGTAAAAGLAVPFIIDNRMVIGKFLILLASWLLMVALQMLLFNTLILGTANTAIVILLFVTSALLSAGGALLVLSWKKRAQVDAEESGPVSRARWKLGVIILAAVIVAGLLGVEILGRSENSGPINQAREILHGNVDDTFGTNRIYIWRNALGVVHKHPIIGSGPDTFGYVFPAEAQWHYGERYDKAHNEYLQILICQGILGLFFYLAFLGETLRRSVMLALKNPMCMAVLAAFFGYCVQAFFNISIPIASQMLWVFAGMLAAFSRSAGHKTPTFS